LHSPARQEEPSVKTEYHVARIDLLGRQGLRFVIGLSRSTYLLVPTEIYNALTQAGIDLRQDNGIEKTCDLVRERIIKAQACPICGGTELVWKCHPHTPLTTETQTRPAQEELRLIYTFKRVDLPKMLG